MSTPPVNESPSWHRADFILRGEYCPLDEVRDHLVRLRVALGADVLVHITTDHEVVMRTLSWAVGEPATATVAFSDWIRKASYRTRNAVARDAFVAVARSLIEPVVELAEDVTNQLVERLLEIRQDAAATPLGEETRSAFAGRSWSGAVLNHTGKPGESPWDGEARSVVLISPPARLHGDDIYRQALDLGVMIKCTAESNARRDSVVMQRVTQRLTFPSPGHEPSTIEEISRRALALAAEITDSSGGAVYLRTPSHGREFQRIAVQADAGFSFPAEIALGQDTTVGWSVERHRAYQRIRGSSAAEVLTPAVRPEGGAELVTPIAGPLADSWAPALGGIVLFRADGGGGYSAYERALVRNVALRLALFRTNIATRQIANAISVLRSGSPRRLQTPPTDAEVNHAELWPKDVAKVTARFDTPLAQLAESTHSHSVTLRIALPHSSSRSEHGLVLARVAAHPSERLNDLYERELEEDSGLHWEVMREGREKYLRSVHRDAKDWEFRPGTVSALCVPVKVEGILAGTLNLESPFADNYAPYLPLIVALSGAVGRTLADARAELEVGLLDTTAHALASQHQYSGVLARMADEIEDVQPRALHDTLMDRTRRLRTLIQDLREPDMPERMPARSLWQIVRDSIDHLGVQLSIVEPAEQLFHLPLLPRVTRALTSVLENVWKNVDYHSSADGRDADGKTVPRATFGLARLDGMKQAMIIVDNLSLNILDENYCAALYRYPAEGSEGEIRLGTYLAGLNARRIGARIHGMPIQGGAGLRTICMIPVEDLRDTASSD
ncbi:hypothetical protein AB0M20_14260 [Actinoplanes sp. NPDC051633]|uniref:hypothetical protein n=1 Tax=Actinoplanes sp. NPDC051633 TaxID=3155670 RepID=UPI0034125E1F